EFTRGQQDQSACMAGGFFAKHFDHRDQKCESLAGAGLGGADYIFSVESGLDGALLNRSEGDELRCRELLLQGRRQGQFGKCGHSKVVSFWRGPFKYTSIQ